MSSLNPFTKHKEFGGDFGVLSITFGLPALLIALNQLANPYYHLVGVDLQWDEFINFRGKSIPDLLFHGQTWCYYLLWFWGLVVFDLIVPGFYLNGVKLRDNTYLQYKINGIANFILFGVLLSYRFWSTSGDLPELQYLYDHLLEFTIVAIEWSFVLSTFVYIYSFFPLLTNNGLGTKEKILAVGGNTRDPIYDWFIGRELNPRIGKWDIKLFCELRPGMLLWLLINLACVHQQWLYQGTVTDSLLLVNILQFIYVLDGVLNEEGCLTMMDITTDGFGYMLCFGDLALVPFSYSLQARYLVLEKIELGFEYSLGILILGLIGFYIFKASNIQKNKFRQGKLNHLVSIQTDTKTKLLCDGWWKLSQHPNYFGDWLYALTWCLATGFTTPLTYYYIFYFGSLLLHRQTRDEAKCRAKYGKYWEEYEARVPYKIVPYVY
jgi:delta14-sterol reductase